MAVMRLPFTQDQNRASQLSCLSVQPLGLINLVPTGSLKAEQRICFFVEEHRCQRSRPGVALIIKGSPLLRRQRVRLLRTSLTC